MTIRAILPLFSNISTTNGGQGVFKHPNTYNMVNYNLSDAMSPSKSMWPSTGTDPEQYLCIYWGMGYGFMEVDNYMLTPGADVIYQRFAITRNHWLPNGTSNNDASDCISIFSVPTRPDIHQRRRVSFENWGRFTINDKQAFGNGPNLEDFYKWSSLNTSQGSTTGLYPGPEVKITDLDTYSVGAEAGRNKFMFEGYNINNAYPPYSYGPSNWNTCKSQVVYPPHVHINKLYYGQYYSSQPSGMDNTYSVINKFANDGYNNIIINWIGNTQTSPIPITACPGISEITTPRTIYTKAGTIHNVPTAQVISFTPALNSPVHDIAPLFPGYEDCGNLYYHPSHNPGFLRVHNRISYYNPSTGQNEVMFDFYTGGPGVLKMCEQQGLTYCPSGLYIEDEDYNGGKFHMCICPAMVGLDPGLDIYHPGKGVAIKSSDNHQAQTEAEDKYGFPFSTIMHFNNYESAGIHIFRAGNGDRTIEDIRQYYTLNTQGSAGLSEFRTVLSNTYIP